MKPFGLIKKMLLSSVFLPAGAVYSAEYGESVRWVKDVEYRAEARYKNDHYEYVLSAARERELKPVIENAREFYSESIGIKKGIESELRTLIETKAKEFGSNLDLRKFEFSLGPFISGESGTHVNDALIALEGTGDGNIETSIGTFKLDAEAVVKYRPHGVDLGRVEVNIKSKEFSLVGDYDFLTGIVNNFRFSEMDLKVDVDTGGVLEPLLKLYEFLTDIDFENEARQSVENSVAGITERLGATNFSIFSLNEALPSGVYVAGGTDIAEEIKRGFQKEVEGQRLELSIYNETIHYSIDNDGSYSNTTNSAVVAKLGRFQLKIWDIPLMGYTPAIHCNWGLCWPDQNQDLPSTNSGWFELVESPIDAGSPQEPNDPVPTVPPAADSKYLIDNSVTYRDTDGEFRLHWPGDSWYRFADYGGGVGYVHEKYTSINGNVSEHSTGLSVGQTSLSFVGAAKAPGTYEYTYSICGQWGPRGGGCDPSYGEKVVVVIVE